MKVEFVKPTKNQNAEFGMVASLVIIILALYTGQFSYVKVAFMLVFFTIIFPNIYSPLTSVWLAVSEILSGLSSIILLSLVFVGVVLPIGLFRKLRGLDNLKLKGFKKNRGSVFTERNHVYSDQDLLHTF